MSYIVSISGDTDSVHIFFASRIAVSCHFDDFPGAIFVGIFLIVYSSAEIFMLFLREMLMNFVLVDAF
jgi:hypothetical protein